MVVEIYQRGPEVWEQRAFSAATPWLVFDYVADFGRHVEWERDLLSVNVFGHGPGVPGAEYLKTYGKPAKGQSAECSTAGTALPARSATLDACTALAGGSTAPMRPLGRPASSKWTSRLPPTAPAA